MKEYLCIFINYFFVIISRENVDLVLQNTKRYTVLYYIFMLWINEIIVVHTEKK